MQTATLDTIAIRVKRAESHDGDKNKKVSQFYSLLRNQF